MSESSKQRSVEDLEARRAELARRVAETAAKREAASRQADDLLVDAELTGDGKLAEQGEKLRAQADGLAFEEASLVRQLSLVEKAWRRAGEEASAADKARLEANKKRGLARLAEETEARRKKLHDLLAAEAFLLYQGDAGGFIDANVLVTKFLSRAAFADARDAMGRRLLAGEELLP